MIRTLARGAVGSLPWALFWAGVLLARWSFDADAGAYAQLPAALGAGAAGLAGMLTVRSTALRKAWTFAALAIVVLAAVVGFGEALFSPDWPCWPGLAAGHFALLRWESGRAAARVASPA